MENPEAVSKINSFMISDIIENGKKKNRDLCVKFFLDKEILKLVKGVA